MFLKRLSWRVAECINRTGFAVFSSLTVTGLENVPREGGLLVVSNHLRMSDIPLLAAGIPRKLVFVGKQELWKSFTFRTLGNWYECFPVDRTTANTRALKHSVQIIRDGGALVIFPEGRRSMEGNLQSGHDGAALIALWAGYPILPVAVTGTDHADGCKWLWRRPKLTVTIGKPFRLAAAERGQAREHLTASTERIMRSIAELLPEAYRGGYKIV